MIAHINPRENWPVPQKPALQAPQANSAAGNLYLQVVLSPAHIGWGRSGYVSDVTLDTARSSPQIAALHLPPLVVKVSWENHDQDLAHEVYYYDVLGPLQGVAIPRCYGYFRGTEVVDAYCDYAPGQPTNLRECDLTGRNRTRVVSVLLLEKVGEKLPLREEPPDGAL